MRDREPNEGTDPIIPLHRTPNLRAAQTVAFLANTKLSTAYVLPYCSCPIPEQSKMALIVADVAPAGATNASFVTCPYA